MIVSSEGCRIECPIDQMKPILTKFNNTTDSDKCQAKIKNVFVSQTLISVRGVLEAFLNFYNSSYPERLPLTSTLVVFKMIVWSFKRLGALSLSQWRRLLVYYRV